MSHDSPHSQNSVTASNVEKEAWYHGLLSTEDVYQLMEKNGDFLVRQAEPKPGEPKSYILSIMADIKMGELVAVRHFVIHESQSKYFVGPAASFNSIREMLAFYMKANTEIVGGLKLGNPIRRSYWELDHEMITLHRKLGEGAFGEVWAGTLTFKKAGKTVQVAVKQAKLEKVGKDKMKDFMNEGRTMRKLGHMNVVKFYGVAVFQEPVFLVMELASHGALDTYLRKHEDYPTEKRQEMLLQAAWGLEYIHGKPMLHRDVAARNCLYGDGKVKISDFGLTRNGTFYQMRPGTRAPVRWSAIETMRTQIYTQKTDVWSFGVLAWEIFNNCTEPYAGLATSEVMSKVIDGHRLPMPMHVNPELRELMEKMFSENPNDRPTMTDVAVVLQRVTKHTRPNFHAIAQREAAELLTWNTVKGVSTKRHSSSSVNKRAAVPKGMREKD